MYNNIFGDNSLKPARPRRDQQQAVQNSSKRIRIEKGQEKEGSDKYLDGTS